MIDTIKLAIPVNRSLRAHNIPWSTAGQDRNGYKAYIYQTKQDKLIQRYVPAISYIERPMPGAGLRYELLVEASLPKLVYGDNLHEVKVSDYGKILNLLRYKLLTYAIPIEYAERLAQAEVRKVDFCKNVEFTNGVLALSVVESIGSADISRIYDIQKTDHKNGGRTHHIHTNCEDIVFYDKVFDLQQAIKSSKRSEERSDFGAIAGLEEIAQKRKFGPYEVVRIEVRLSSKPKLRQMFNKVDEKPVLTFENIYQSKIAKKILLFHLNNIIGGLNATTLELDTPSNMLMNVLARQQIHGPQATFAEVGFRLVANDMANNIRKLREIVVARLGKDAWRRLEKYRKFLPRTQIEALNHIREEVESM